MKNKDTITTENKEHTITYNVPLFLHHQSPHGFLSPEPEAHALWYYYLLARKNYEEETDGIVYEGDADPVFNYHQLFSSIAQAYGVEPGSMVRCWQMVDAECALSRMPKMPEGERYRFDKPVIIETGVKKDAADNIE